MSTILSKMLLFLLAMNGFGLAKVIHVPEKFTTIQEAILFTGDGDTILISPGVYVENIDFLGKQIVVASHFLISGNDTFIKSTRIDGGGLGSVVTFQRNETAASQLIGLTIKNGTGKRRNYLNKPFYYGGGIFCEGASPTLSHLIIKDCRTNAGGGIFLKFSDAIINNVVCEKNIVDSPIWESPNVGGGILIWNSNPVVRQCKISGNRSGLAGGGVYSLQSTGEFYNVTITNNSSGMWGGGVFCETYDSSCFSNVTITGNIARYGGGIYLMNKTRTLLFNTIVWYNEPQQLGFHNILTESGLYIDHCNIQNGIKTVLNIKNNTIHWLQNNITKAPDFVDYRSGNYQLTEHSPCRDGGGMWFFLNEDTLFSGFRYNFYGENPDIGAFEFNPGTIAESQTGEKTTGNSGRKSAKKSDGPVMVADQPESISIIPKTVALKGNYPNPFNPSTTIRYELFEPANVRLIIFDLLGNEIKTLIQNYQNTGLQNVVWDGTDTANNQVGSGIYFYQLIVGRTSVSQSMLLLR